MATKRCMCCGGTNKVVQMELRDGRTVRSCDDCLSRCEFCRLWLSQVRPTTDAESEYG